MKRVALLAAAALTCLPMSSLAWGPKAHQVIAEPARGPMLTAAQAARSHKDDDVVSVTDRVVTALERPEQTGSTTTHRRALKWLVHLVADLHCPVYAAACYYAPRSGGYRVVTDPASVFGSNAGRGGDEIGLLRAAEELAGLLNGTRGQEV